MNRRQFLRRTAAALALSTLPSYAVDFADMKKRVGLIGTGWYGKVDLLRLIQVAPVEVVSLCDVDKTMLSDAADLVATRQTLQEEAAHLRRLPRDAQGKGSRHRPHRHARSLARAADDRGRAKPGRTFTARNPSAWMWSKARPCWPPRANTGAWCRSAPNAAARRI